MGPEGTREKTKFSSNGSVWDPGSTGSQNGGISKAGDFWFRCDERTSLKMAKLVSPKGNTRVGFYKTMPSFPDGGVNTQSRVYKSTSQDSPTVFKNCNGILLNNQVDLT